MKHAKEKKIRKKLPLRMRFSLFFLRRLLPCLLVAAAADAGLLYHDYNQAKSDLNFGGEEWESACQYYFSNYQKEQPYAEEIVKNQGGTAALLQQISTHQYPIVENSMLIPTSDISVMLIRRDTGETEISAPAVKLHTMQVKYGSDRPNDADRYASKVYYADPAEAEQIAEDVLDYIKAHILSAEFYGRDYCGDASPLWFFLSPPVPAALRAAVRDDRFMLLDSGYVTTGLPGAIELKGVNCRNVQIPDGWQIVSDPSYKIQNGSYVDDREFNGLGSLPAGSEMITDLEIDGYPTNCKAGTIMRETASLFSDEVQQIQNKSVIYEETCAMAERLAMSVINAERNKPENKWMRYFTRTTPVTLNNTEYCLFCIMTSDLRNVLYTDFVFRSIQLGLAAVLLALLWTLLLYPKMRRKYELDDYRRSLTAALAHDLKSPLAAISGYAENLRSGVHPEKQAHYADSILEGTQYMDNIITNVLDLSKLEQNAKAKKQRLELIRMMQELRTNRQDETEARKLQIEITGSCTVRADPLMMTQALRNLLDNAVKFTPDGGCITVTGERHTLRIVNDIAEDRIEHVEQLCEAFVKGDSARSSRQGTGLGLSVVRQIAELNKLHLSIASSGHTFTVMLRS